MTDEAAQNLRFALLLGMLASLLVFAPLLDVLRDVSGFRLVFTGVYVAGVAALSGRRAVLFVGVLLATPALLSEWLSYLTGFEAFVGVNTLSSALFLAFTAAVILRTMLRQRRVTTGTILGGLCIYLLIGIFFVEVYSLVEFLSPGSFLYLGEPLTAVTGAAAQYARYPGILYYSFVTLTTLGYGDVVPASHVARSMAVSEAVLGQLYVAVFIARLVGLHLAESARRDA